MLTEALAAQVEDLLEQIQERDELIRVLLNHGHICGPGCAMWPVVERYREKLLPQNTAANDRR